LSGNARQFAVKPVEFDDRGGGCEMTRGDTSIRRSPHDVNFGSPNEKEPSGRSPGGSFPQLPDRVRFHRYDFGEAVKVRAVFAGL
jgi:hypothetical protein